MNHSDDIIQLLSGAVILTYIMGGMYFIRFWRKTSDFLFLSFAFAFGLLALNQILVSLFWAAGEGGGYAYVLRVLGFGLILFAIIGKNTFASRRSSAQPFRNFPKNLPKKDA